MGILETSKLCRDFAPEEVMAFEALTRRRRASDGDTLIDAGAPNASLFVVDRGAVRIHRGAMPLAELGPGETFGEMSFLDGSPTSASVRAVGETELLELSHAMLDDLLEDNPLLWGKLWRNLALVLKERLLHANELFERHVDVASLDPDEPGLRDGPGRC